MSLDTAIQRPDAEESRSRWHCILATASSPASR